MRNTVFMWSSMRCITKRQSIPFWLHCEGVLSCVQTNQKRMRKRKISPMFVVYCLISSCLFVNLFRFRSHFAWCEKTLMVNSSVPQFLDLKVVIDLFSLFMLLVATFWLQQAINKQHFPLITISSPTPSTHKAITFEAEEAWVDSHQFYISQSTTYKSTAVKRSVSFFEHTNNVDSLSNLRFGLVLSWKALALIIPKKFLRQKKS